MPTCITKECDRTEYTICSLVEQGFGTWKYIVTWKRMEEDGRYVYEHFEDVMHGTRNATFKYKSDCDYEDVRHLAIR